MEIYKGLTTNDKMSLGDMRAIKLAFGKPVEEIDFKGFDPDAVIKFITCLVMSAGAEDMEHVEARICAIPFDEVTKIFDQIAKMMPGSSKSSKKRSHQDGNLQEGREKNVPTQV